MEGTVPTVKEYVHSTEQREKSSGRKEGCVFCTIARGEDPAADLLYQDAEVAAFRNITPAATHHYLVVPREHVRDGTELQEHHLPLLIRMEKVGREVLRRQGGDQKPHRLGYHWPPFVSVPHLHLHVISPEHEMSLYSRTIFLPGTQWFRTTEEMIRGLRRPVPRISSSL